MDHPLDLEFCVAFLPESCSLLHDCSSVGLNPASTSATSHAPLWHLDAVVHQISCFRPQTLRGASQAWPAHLQGLASLLRHANLAGAIHVDTTPRVVIQKVEVLDGPWFRR